MAKTLGWLVIGMFAAIVALVFVRPMFDTTGGDTMTEAREAAGTMSSSEYRTLSERVTALEARVSEMTLLLEERSSEPTISADSTSSGGRPGNIRRNDEISALADRIRTPGSSPSSESANSEQLIDQLIAGGLAQQRAEWIKQRIDGLTLELIKARYEAERSGVSLTDDQLHNLRPEGILREELGDAEYEHYLRALGREPTVSVMTVIENSPAARAGLLAGDQIVSYAGTRVFDFTEVTPLALQGTPGESVIVDIVRDGQSMQVVVPRGPLGIRLYSGRSSSIGVAQQP